uniref:Uncharacterized protein n=1 Tax=Anopheles dirus TaxID=7168 RepID=A0A182N3W0_9DIPT
GLFWFCITSLKPGLCVFCSCDFQLIDDYNQHVSTSLFETFSCNGTDRFEREKLRFTHWRHRGIHSTGLLPDHRTPDAAPRGIQKSATNEPGGYKAGRDPARKYACVE